MGNELAAQVSRMDAFLDKLIELCTTAGVKILIAILIYIVGKFIIGKLMKMVDKMHSVSRLDDTAKSYIRNIIKAVLYVVLVVAIISELGIPMASVITVLASAGVAVGMALQGSLSNLAGGIMLLVFRPFNVGDYIIAGGDFNKDLLGDSSVYFGVSAGEQTWAQPFPTDKLPDDLSLQAPLDENAPVPSCRNCDTGYIPGQTFVLVVDGFLVSDNVTVLEKHVIDADFETSDHNPVSMTFVLN